MSLHKFFLKEWINELKFINHGCIKPGFAIENYSIDGPINSYLNQHVLKHNAWFAFYHIFIISVAYKI